MCGEKSWLFSSTSNWAGSPPRVRGKGSDNTALASEHRITPACAGKRPTIRIACTPRRDHPRVCGEKKSLHARSIASLGSPPRVRGKVSFLDGNMSVKGITPAYAGKSYTSLIEETKTMDHPRVCGEKQIPQTYISRSRGSPPRMRGKVVQMFHCFSPFGITPAYAGKRKSCPRILRCARDHPRVCGEKS